MKAIKAEPMDAEMMGIMVADYQTDHEEIQGCTLEGEPYYDEESGYWMQDARDEEGRLFFLYAHGGNIFCGS